MKKFGVCVVSMTLLLVILSASGTAFAEYPEKPIQVIVGFNPGGGTDTMARLVTKYAAKYIKGTFEIVNMPGKGGEIGFAAIAKSSPDGYHIGCINPPAFLTYPLQREGVEYHVSDFFPIANIVMDPGAIIVKVDSPITSLKELLGQAKEKPGTLKMAYTGPGTSEAYALQVIKGETGAEFQLVTSNETATSLPMLEKEEVDAVAVNASEIHALVQENKVRVLAVGSPERIEWLPEVPTYKEEGIDFISGAFRSFAAPKDINPQHVRVLEEAFRKAVQDPGFKAEAEEMQFPLYFMGNIRFRRLLHQMDIHIRAEWKKGAW